VVAQAKAVTLGGRSLSLIWLIFILWLAFGLRLYHLGGPSIWYDEGWSVHYAAQGLAAVTSISTTMDHPPFYYYLLSLWMRAAGQSEFGLRFLSLLADMATIALAVRLGRTLFKPSVGILAGLLISLSPLHIYYAQQARMYTLVAALIFGSLYLAWQGIRTGKRLFLGGQALLMALALYTHYYAGLVLLAANVLFLAWWLARRRENKAFVRRWLWSQGASALLFVPWLPFALRQVLEPSVPPWRGFTALPILLERTGMTLSLGHAIRAEDWWAGVAAVVFSGLAGLGLLRWRSGALLVASLLIGFLALLYLFSFVTPLFNERYVFLVSPLYLLLVAAGLEATLAVGTPLFFLALMVLSSVWGLVLPGQFGDVFPNDDFRSAAARLASRYRPGSDALVVNAGYVYPALLYYQANIAWRGPLVGYREGLEAGSRGLLLLQGGSINARRFTVRSDDYYFSSPEATEEALERVAASHRRVWLLLVYDTVTDPGGVVQSWMDKNLFKEDQVSFRGTSNMRLSLYSTRVPPDYRPPQVQYPHSVDLPGIGRFVGYDLESGTLSPGDTLRLTLYWQPDQPIEAEYFTFVHLVDAQGKLLSQHDGPPLEGSYPTTRWQPGEIVREEHDVPLPKLGHSQAAGVYVGLYRRDNGVRARTPTGETWIPLQRVCLKVGEKTAATAESRIDLGGKVALVGYQLPTETAAGSSLPLTLYWWALLMRTTRSSFIWSTRRDRW